ncbi:hypothetical protein CRV24_008816 [Beauveria bassiana]|nr:hypothetical protein CRV24_008816 [Beauveria bassiana]
MGAHLGHAALLEHDNQVRVENGAQPVGDKDARAGLFAQDAVDVDHEALLRVGVERAGGLVKEEQRRVLEQQAAHGQALLLAAGNHEPALADFGVVAVGEARNRVVDAGALRGGHHLRARRVDGAVANVVLDRVVEERRVLRDDANGAAQGVDLDVANVLVVNEDAAALGVVGAKQQPQQRRLAAAAGPDNGHLFAGGDGEAEVLQDGPVRVVAKGDILEANLAALGQGQLLGAGLVGDADIDLLQAEERLHVEQRLAQLAVHGAEKVERHGQLEDELVDHDQAAFGDAVGGKVHHCRQGGREDDVLATVEERQRSRDLDGALFVLFERLVVASHLKLFIVKVLDRLVVDERVDRDCRRLVIGCVGLTTKLCAPGRGPNGKGRVADHGQRRDGGKLGAVLPGQDAADHANLERRGQDVKDHAREQEADALGAAVNGARQAARLLGQVKGEVEAQQVAKDVARDGANGLLRDRREDGVAQLLKDGRADARGPVAENHGAGDRRGGAADGRHVNVHRVDDALEVKRHLHVEHLGANEQRHGQAHAQLGAQVVLGPQVPRHFLHDGPVGLALLRDRLVRQ